MKEEQAKELLQRYLDGKTTLEENRLVEAWYQQQLEQGDFQWQEGEMAAMEAEMEAELLAQIASTGPGITATGPEYGGALRKFPWRWMAAASVLLIAGASIWWMANYRHSKELVAANHPQQPQSTTKDIAPGGNRAVLTLAGGTTIVLDSAADGVLSQQGGTRITKLANGQLQITAIATGKEVQYNTISTPRGGRYQIQLPDGSKAWLNAASSLRFPNMFTGKEREVTLTGEGYFEIAADKARPFRVRTSKTTVEVLGTDFNINAYSDEDELKTTLVQGVVKVDAGTQSILLAPGQQLGVKDNGALRLEKHADVDQVIAWKDGYFQFDGISLAILMRQLARWYDLEVIYEGTVPDHEFSGKISQQVNLSTVLDALRMNNVEFRLEGKKLFVK